MIDPNKIETKIENDIEATTKAFCAVKSGHPGQRWKKIVDCLDAKVLQYLNGQTTKSASFLCREAAVTKICDKFSFLLAHFCERHELKFEFNRSRDFQVTDIYLYQDTNNVTPLIFVLSTGSDPMSGFLKFTEEMQLTDKFNSLSLGQGQGPAAESLLEKALVSGHWVFLQNCHLAVSWMPKLETVVRNIALGATKAHEDFRLFLSSMPTKTFPITILQNSIKVTNEPPKGLRSNLSRALGDLNADFFDHHILGPKWRSIVFGLCMFHAVVLERRKFGPLGWNILYEFSENDRECGLNVLETFIDREITKPIPWDALNYINGEITWGGRVTDYWDQRCLRTILQKFSGPDIVGENVFYSETGTYRDPKCRTLRVCTDYVLQLPFDDDPNVFGMHENANILFQTKEAEFFLNMLTDAYPRQALSDNKRTKDNEICLEIIDNISSDLHQEISKNNPFKDLMVSDENGRLPSLTTVLLQEIDRYNILLGIVHESLINLRKAIKGLVVMSDLMEETFQSILKNAVPALWASKGFLSIKSLINWVRDFQRRIHFIQTWHNEGPPTSFWFSGFYFPQAFLTGVLQTYARQNAVPIDSLKFDFQVLKVSFLQDEVFDSQKTGESDKMFKAVKVPNAGVYIHGLFIEGATWDAENGGICDGKSGELYVRMPVIWFKPMQRIHASNRYEAPLYKTQTRAGVLSTTGHSTNFVLPVLLDSEKPAEFLILRGTALVTSVADNLA